MSTLSPHVDKKQKRVCKQCTSPTLFWGGLTTDLQRLWSVSHQSGPYPDFFHITQVAYPHAVAARRLSPI
uniref:Uncharacterized protein n=1 Tax=Leishmania guyanensis TaxID=5670 RepID=A0A1E1JAB2_LEIGU|nr:Hypothetical protein BN36_NA76500 [Leishmania guyanensis]CCM43477.1 Hypothetical protein BN36_NA76840 [Leishmania guyanensis]